MSICDNCGCEFPHREAVNDSTNVPFKSPGKYPYTRIQSITLCKKCGAKRKGLLAVWCWTAVVAALAFWLISKFLER
jgi:hypothetical protein